MDDEELNTEKILEIFYSTKGGIDKVNAAIDTRLKPNPLRPLSLFDKFVQARISRNATVLKLADMEITALRHSPFRHFFKFERIGSSKQSNHARGDGVTFKNNRVDRP